MVSERMDGTLHDLDWKTVAPTERARSIKTIETLVKNLHKLGILHMDLNNTRNILYKRQKNGKLEWKLTDFGESLFGRSVAGSDGTRTSNPCRRTWRSRQH